MTTVNVDALLLVSRLDRAKSIGNQVVRNVGRRWTEVRNVWQDDLGFFVMHNNRLVPLVWRAGGWEPQ